MAHNLLYCCLLCLLLLYVSMRTPLWAWRPGCWHTPAGCDVQHMLYSGRLT